MEYISMTLLPTQRSEVEVFRLLIPPSLEGLEETFQKFLFTFLHKICTINIHPL
jgi:hypothetical protein